MQELNLPKAELQLKKEPDGSVKVYDPLRRRWLTVTPEEWVRQNFVRFLIDHRGYPESRIANEFTISLNSTRKRCDSVIFADDLSPLAIVEYKAPEIRLTQKVFDQIARYNIVLSVPLLIVSNGISHYACHISDGRCRFLSDIPSYSGLIQKK